MIFDLSKVWYTHDTMLTLSKYILHLLLTVAGFKTCGYLAILIGWGLMKKRLRCKLTMIAWSSVICLRNLRAEGDSGVY